MQASYQAVDPNSWQGRSDSQARERYYQVVRCINLQEQTFTPCPGDYAMVGFCVDSGIKRNLGRVGSAQGANALRNALANFSLTTDPVAQYFDVGNIYCQEDALEAAQEQLATVVTRLLQQGVKPVVLGGGHETAWGHYLGIARAESHASLGIINIDAHFDLRQPNVHGLGTSGTPFYQIAMDRQQRGMDFSYLCLGIQPLANTRSLFATARGLHTHYLFAEQIQQQTMQQTVEEVQAFIDRHKAIYLSVCLDVFAAAVAPGVSAPQVLGLWPQHVLPVVRSIAASQKVVSMDIVELSPPFDHDGMTARLAASVLAEFLAASD